MIGALAQAASPARGLLRVSRAAGLAWAALSCAAVAHLVADDCLSVPGLAVAAVALLPGAWTFTTRQRSTREFAGWLLASQVGLHGVLAGMCGSSLAGAVPPLAVVLAHLVTVAVLAVVLCAADRGSWQRAAVALARLLTPPAAVVCGPVPPVALPVGGRVTVASSTSPRTANVLRGPPVAA